MTRPVPDPSTAAWFAKTVEQDPDADATVIRSGPYPRHPWDTPYPIRRVGGPLKDAAPPPPGAPALNADATAWRAFAVGQGADAKQMAKLTRDQVRALWVTP